MELFVICLLLSLGECSTKTNNEFNSNIFDDDIEYALIDNSDEGFADGLEHFFRQVRSLEEDYKNVETIDTQEYYRKVPKTEFERKLREINDFYSDDPVDFDNRYEEEEDSRRFRRSVEGGGDGGGEVDARAGRFRRSAQNDLLDEKEEKKDLQELVDNGEKPLEIIVLDISNGTENGLELKETSQFHSEDDALKINDFIRFKRDVQDENATKMVDDDKSRLKRERDENDSKRDVGIKEQWMKQPFPVSRTADQHRFDDSLRTPRINFITQRRSESASPPVYYNYEPSYRYPDFPDDYDRGYYSRVPRHYQGYQDPYHRNYYRDENTRYQHRNSYEPDDSVGNYHNERPVYRQRRIIYYATLPEVVRSPPPVGDLGDRYNYRDPYEVDGRYGRVPSQNAHRIVDPYRFRKPFPVEKSRYDESEPVKGAYPLKVSADVNVKEIKKNPERRIFSEGDHRYNHGPYQPLDRY